MGNVRHGFHEFLDSYLNDILIQSLTWEEDLKFLATVLDKLRENGLKDKQNIRTFVTASCGYLGYIVESVEIHYRLFNFS